MHEWYNLLFLYCRKTKVFMKYYHLEQLSDVFKKMGKSAIKIQKGLYNHITNMFNIYLLNLISWTQIYLFVNEHWLYGTEISL